MLANLSVAVRLRVCCYGTLQHNLRALHLFFSLIGTYIVVNCQEWSGLRDHCKEQIMANQSLERISWPSKKSVKRVLEDV